MFKVVCLCSCFILLTVLLPTYTYAQYCAQPSENTQYESITSHAVTQCGDQVTMEVVVNAIFTGDIHFVWIYFDKDQDGNTYETGYNLGLITYNGTPSTFTLTVDDFTNGGANNYRVIMAYQAAPTGPCNTLPTGPNYGDVEDGVFIYDDNTISANPSNANGCLGETISVSSNTSGGVPGYTYLWSITGGSSTGSTISNATSSTITLNTASATAGTVDLSLTVTDASGCGASDTDFALVDIGNPVTVSAGSDITSCSNQLTLNGSISGAINTGVWTGGLGVFNPSATALNATYTPTAAEINAGSITLTLTADDPAGPCTSESDAVTFTFEAPVVVDAGSDDIFCSDLASIALNGDVSGAITTGEWSGGAGTFNPNAQTLNAVYTPTPAEISSGSITLVLTSDDPVGACNPAFDDVVYTIQDALIVDAGDDFTTCDVVNIPLSGSITGSVSSIIWTGAGTFSPNANSLNTTYTPSAAEISNGSATLTLTANPSSGACSIESDQIILTLATNVTVDAGEPVFDCSNQSFALNGSITGTTTAAWIGGDGIFNPDRNALDAVYTPSAGELASGAVDLTLAAGNADGSTDLITLNLSNAITANLATATVCGGNDLMVSGNPAGGSGNYILHNWALGAGTTATGVVLTNEDTENVTLNANTQGAVYLEYTVTDDQGCSASATTHINFLYSPMCTISGPVVSCSGDNITLEYLPTELATTPPLGSVVNGTQGQIETHTFDGVTSPEDVTVILTLPTWDDSFYETTLNGNVIFPASNEPQSWGAGGLNIDAPWTPNNNGLPRTIITLTSTSVTYQVSQNVNSTVMTTVVPTNWVTTPQPFQVGSNTLVFGIKNTAGPTGGSWTVETFQDYNVSYLWSTGSTASSIDVSPTATTTYQVTVSNTTGCSRVCSHTVTVEGSADAGPDGNLCSGDTISLSGIIDAGGTGIWSGGGGIFIPSNTTLEAQYVPTEAEVNSGSVTLTLTSDIAGSCSVLSDDVIYTINDLINVDAGGNQARCNDITTITLNGSVSGAVTTGTWSGGNGTFSPDANTLDATYTPTAAELSSGSITLTLTSADPAGPCGPASDDITIVTVPCESQLLCSTIALDDFELGWGIWNDGGSDSWRTPQTQFANSGIWSIRLRHDSPSSVMTSNTLDMSAYETAVIEFNYYVVSFDNANEDFFLEMSLDGGVTYTQVEEWNFSDEFVNNQRYFETVTISGVTFTTNTVFRFRSDADANNDRLYIDDVEIQGCVSVVSPACNLVSFEDGLALSGSEDNLGTLSIDLEIPAPLTTDLIIPYYTLDGAANSGTDYVGVSNAVAVITAGNTSTSVSGTPIEVVINADTDIENDEDFQIVISSNSEVCANPDSILTVTIVNDEISAPNLTNIENDNLLYCPASGISTIVTQTIIVDEPQGNDLTATVTITGTTDPAADTLSVDLSAYPTATATYSYPTLTIVGAIPPADMQDILRSVEFTTNSDVMGVRSIEVVVNNGIQNSNTNTRNINSDETDAGCCNAAAPSIEK